MAKIKSRHIAVAGNIGSGKTTLTGLLAEHYGWEPQYEANDHNPYLVDFYRDMPRCSFNIQIYFLHSRLRQLLALREGKKSTIQDRTIYEDGCIFAFNLYEMGGMSKRDFENYRSLFDTLESLIHPPDLLIYLRASIPALVDQIQKRGREYEENLRLDYLKRLNGYYNNWFDSYTLGPTLVIDIDELNFVDKPEDLAEVIRQVDSLIHGLF